MVDVAPCWGKSPCRIGKVTVAFRSLPFAGLGKGCTFATETERNLIRKQKVEQFKT